MDPSRKQFDAIVVGSGFGGSIAALRLAEAGKSVLVLERGASYRPGEFPRDVTKVDQLLWRYPQRPASRGLYDVRFFSGLGVVAASGVGGGSLIYANIHIRPDADVFESARWAGMTRRRLEPYYDRVAAMLGVAPLPVAPELPKRTAYRDAAHQLGREVFDPDQAVHWQAPAGPGRQACQGCTQCEFGCQFGAKNTLDFTYLAAAQERGAEIRSGQLVTAIEPTRKVYRVHFRDVASGRADSATGTRVVVSAGTLGTNELLLRNRDELRTLPSLSRTLGTGFSGNGDFLGSIQNSRHDLHPWEGPDVTSVIRYNSGGPHFTMAAPTFNREVMEVLASFGQGRLTLLRLVAPLLWRCMGAIVPSALRAGLLSKPSRLPARNAGDPARMTNLFAIGRDNANGVMRLKRGRLDIDWDYVGENRDLVAKMTEAMEEVSAIYGGTFSPIATWMVFRRIITVHPLGGCAMADGPDRGVVASHGEVHGYPGLFVADGSIIPTAIGFHPAMTISAMSERVADAVVASY